MGLLARLSRLLHSRTTISRRPRRPKQESSRLCRFEAMEPRRLLSAEALKIGAVYLEEDSGSDMHGDTFQVAFEGGAPGTQLNRLVISGDRGQPGLSAGDVLFDTEPGYLGADHAFPFTLVSLSTANPAASVRSSVADGGTQLVLDLTGFQAGDKLVFSIDVDEVEQWDATETELAVINEGLDPVTSGVEFQGSLLAAYFSAPHYHDISGTAEFRNRYDDLLAGKGLDLPADDEGGKRDRSAGTAMQLVQQPLPVSIEGTVYLETDLDLVQDAGEDGIANVQLALWRKEGQAYVFTGHTVRTDSTGNYKFGLNLELLPGTYQVREAQPEGLFSVGAVPGTVAGERAGTTVLGDPDILSEIVIPLGGQEAIDYDFAEALPARVSGHVYHDRNNDGIRQPASEEGLGGITIQVIPVTTVSDQSAVTVTTDANGYYEATGLAPGTYRVVEPAQPPGYFDGLDTPGTVNGSQVGAAVNPGDRIEGIFLGGGQAGVEYDFGEIAPASVRGKVTLTQPDGSCFVPGCDRPLADVTVRLLDPSGTELAVTATNELGEYAFTDLFPGTYTVVEVTPANLIDGQDHVGTVSGVKVGRLVANDVIGDIVLGAGQAGIDYDFCEHLLASLSGFVYHDANNNGVFDAGEEPIAGVLLTLLDAQGSAAATQRTDSSGAYAFTRLHAGSYTVVESHPTGWTDGQDTAGSVAGTSVGQAVNPGDRIEGIVLQWGDEGVDYDFGELKPARISGTVYQSGGHGTCFEPGPDLLPLAGVSILLQGTEGSILARTTTDAQGRYQFTGLLPGIYTVVEQTPEGWIDGGERVGTVHGNPVGYVQENDVIGGIWLLSGEAGEDYDFCEHPPSSLSGHVYHDLNNDGRFGEDEPPIAGVLVALQDETGGIVATARTAEDGSFAFLNLPAGLYALVETHPDGWLDGQDAEGTIEGIRTGRAINPGDEIQDIHLRWGEQGVDYDFGELLPSSLAGLVHVDSDGDCKQDTGEPPLSGITLQLLDARGNVVATTQTNAAGQYRFAGLLPGVYEVREEQPAGYFQGCERVGSHGGVAGTDRIGSIRVLSGEDLVHYDFCEIPPSRLSGYVFQDGPPIVVTNGQLPEKLSALRDGQRTADDTPIPGVVIELRDGLTGEPIDASEALPGTYPSGPIRAITDATGFYEFPGLRGGRSYAVYELHPAGFVDGIDTPGTAMGIAFNPDEEVSPVIVSQLTHDPKNDAIVRIGLKVGQSSENNNFSEVVLKNTSSVVPDYPSTPRPGPLPPVFLPPLLAGPPGFGIHRETIRPTIVAGGGMGEPAFTWHLSVVDAGMPRNADSADATDPRNWMVTTYLDFTNWKADRLRGGSWMTPVSYRDGKQDPDFHETLFGIQGAIPVVGDFNGDGISEIGVYYLGEWFLDLNRNGRWDEDDLWARLGTADDLPVTGDWNGDGKDDIGIFGPEWEGDARALRVEPGLPDSENSPKDKPKNVPPRPHEATDGRRYLKRSIKGPQRADVIDHVFRFGSGQDMPVAGDWNGDGIRTIGVFRDGRWRLDLDGDGKFTERDATAQFGVPGDLPVVGDFNGDGVDEIGVYRRGTWYVDLNGNRSLDAHDKVFEMGGAADFPVVGDWNGDGIDEPGLYRGTSPPSDTPVSQPSATPAVE